MLTTISLEVRSLLLQPSSYLPLLFLDVGNLSNTKPVSVDPHSSIHSLTVSRFEK